MLAALVPPAVVTRMLAVPALPAGVEQVAEVAEAKASFEVAIGGAAKVGTYQQVGRPRQAGDIAVFYTDPCVHRSAHIHRREFIGSRGICGVLAGFVCWQVAST